MLWHAIGGQGRSYPRRWQADAIHLLRPHRSSSDSSSRMIEETSSGRWGGHGRIGDASGRVSQSKEYGRRVGLYAIKSDRALNDRWTLYDSR